MSLKDTDMAIQPHSVKELYTWLSEKRKLLAAYAKSEKAPEVILCDDVLQHLGKLSDSRGSAPPLTQEFADDVRKLIAISDHTGANWAEAHRLRNRILAALSSSRSTESATEPPDFEEMDRRICLLPKRAVDGVDYVSFAAVLLLIRDHKYRASSSPSEAPSTPKELR